MNRLVVRRLIVLGFMALASLFSLLPRPTHAADRYIMLMDADGAIVPAMYNYIDRGVGKAETDNAALVIIQLDTPGGSVAVMEDIIQRIRGADVPVVVYITPSGAWAASAGALITMSGHAAAMTPGTSIGAASPINSDGSDLNETSDLKAKEILTATARSLTESRPPEAQALAEAMITDAEAITASEAFEVGLIDYLADDVDDLIAQMDGQTLVVGDDEVALSLAGLDVQEVNMNLIEQALLILTDPSIVFILLSTGVLLIILELRAPGGFVMGTLGFVLLLLSFYGLNILPVNLLGFIFFGIAIVFFVAEVLTPQTFGLLTTAAAVSMAIGGLILFRNAEVDQFGGVPSWLIIGQSGGVAVIGVLLFLYVMRYAPISGPMTGQAGMIGLLGEVRVPLEPQGMVFVNGERWKAQTESGTFLDVGETIRVVRIEDLLLTVEPVEASKRDKIV